MKYYNALFQAIKNEYKERNSDAIIAFSPNGFIYDNEDFDLLNQENLDRGKLLTKEDLSYQFNSLTSNVKSWEIDVSNNLYLKYKELIQLAELNSRDSSSDFSDQMAILYNDKGVETAAYKKYKTYVNKYNNATDLLQDHLSNDDLSVLDDLQKINWTSKLETLQNNIKIILSEWIAKGNKVIISNALDKIYQENVIKNTSLTLSELKQNIAFQEKTGLNSNSDYIEMQFIPFDFTSDNSKWSHLKLDKTKLNSLSDEFKKENSINNSTIDLDDKYEKYINAVEFDFCIVNINRSWFRKEIISTDLNSNSPATKECFYASKLIFMKNLSIDLIDFEEDNIINEGIIKFGPLILKNQIFKNITTKKLSLQPIDSKDIYKSNNYKILSQQREMVTKPIKETIAAVSTPVSQIRNPNIIRPPMFTRLEAKSDTKTTTTFGKVIEAQKINKINFLPVINFQLLDNTGNLILRISNKIITDKVEANCTISIIGINNEFIKEVVSDINGQLVVSVPIGDYNISIKKSGFKPLEFKQTIGAAGNIIVNKTIDPTNIIYESMYLIGVCLNDLK